MREAARAFTGWHTDGELFTFAPRYHDSGSKTVLGKTGDWDGADIQKIALTQPAAALFLARRIRVPVFVMAVEGTRDKARRNVERVATLAAPLGVTVAVEGPEHSPPGSAVHMVEEELETKVGIALDFGRADREGDLVEAIEVVAEHLVAVRLPVDGNIDWASVMTTVQKVGYEGPLVFDGQKLIPSVTRVFSKSRDLFVFLQAYQRGATTTQPLRSAAM